MTSHLERSHSIVLSGPVDRVFPLFSPIGESLWVAGWDPEFLHPQSGETRQGMVFRTTHGDETTLWACTHWDPRIHQVRYVRVTPDSRFGFVDVACRQVTSGDTEALISYTLTALSEAGRSYLSELTEDAFTGMIETWKVRIDASLLSDVSAGSGHV
ncbi:MAG: SRPBCC family protein [Mesorhizobium sp.]|nr:SRPBCC family protein [Mesorhizobium sp. M8A.F.Ca.ET.023.01.1.1]RWC77907.1 MAG: SRPBCC family protein [Mesorhizobium sp.]